MNELLRDAVGFMHPAFVDATKPTSVLCEFYHQFRKLWDRGIPVGLGLGHLLVKSIDAHTLGIHRLGEHGKKDEALAAVSVVDCKAVAGFEKTYVISYEPLTPLPGVTVLHVAGRTVTLHE